MMPPSNFMTPVRRFFTDRAWREEKVAAYASIGLLVFLTSFFWAPTRDFMHVVYGLAFFVPVLFVLLFRRPDFNQYGGCFTGLALLYAGYASISTLWSDAPRLEFFVQHFLFLAVWLAGAAWLASRGQLNIERLYQVLIVTGTVASVAFQLIFHVQGYFAGYDPNLGTRLGFTSFGVTKNTNTIGLVFGATTLLAYVWWLQSKGWRQGVGRFLLLLLNGSAVLATQSRGPILALAFTLALGFALYRGPSRKWKTHLFAILLLFGGFTVAIHQQFIPNRWDSASLASSLRPEIWQHMISKTVQEHLWFGEGLVKTTRIHVPGQEAVLPFTHHAHNAYIDAFYWTGLIGLLLMAGHLIYVLRHWSNSPRTLPLFLWFLLGCLTALVDRPGFFEHLTPHWFVYWIPAGLIGALVMAERPKSSST
jgi:hypothetical protein